MGYEENRKHVMEFNRERIAKVHGKEFADLYIEAYNDTAIYINEKGAAFDFLKQLVTLAQQIKDPQVKSVLLNPYKEIKPKNENEDEKIKIKALNEFREKLKTFIHENAQSFNQITSNKNSYGSYDRVRNALDNAMNPPKSETKPKGFDKIKFGIWQKISSTFKTDLKKVANFFDTNYAHLREHQAPNPRGNKK